MEGNVTVITQPIVNLYVTSNINTFGAQRRFQKNITVGELKGKLELVTGATSSNMVLQLFDQKDTLVVQISDDKALLGSYPVEDDMRLHVIDDTLKAGVFEDTAAVERFQLSDEDYSKRTDSIRAFQIKNKLGKYAPRDEAVENEKKLQQEAEENLAKTLTVDSRCEVAVPGQMTRRGAVQYVGEVHFKSGWWVGVQYDEPYGKNDGSVDGQRYFECRPKYGGFVKPQHVTVGDFPEEEVGLDEEM